MYWNWKVTKSNPRRNLPYVKASGSVWLFKISVWQHCRHRWRQAWLLMKMAVNPQWELWLCKADAKVFTWVSPSIPAPKIHLFFISWGGHRKSLFAPFCRCKWMREPADWLVYMCTLSFTDTNNPTTTPPPPNDALSKKTPKYFFFCQITIGHHWIKGAISLIRKKSMCTLQRVFICMLMAHSKGKHLTKTYASAKYISYWAYFPFSLSHNRAAGFTLK